MCMLYIYSMKCMAGVEVSRPAPPPVKSLAYDKWQPTPVFYQNIFYARDHGLCSLQNMHV